MACVPIVFGCPTIVKPTEDSSPRLCPKCNNGIAVIDAKERIWFELCFLRLFPFHSSRIWHCTICRWQVPHQANWEPTRPGGGFVNHSQFGSPAPPPPSAAKPSK
ncbi:hypothetical protein BKA62DRAFT_684344 [Auriculariales sp. MPI-PUGE-AT-0066]|nr:hypothetical protein BKA62DRAFT_684344 [Auriculariales sp. MPI-PUGE-AT-0066]